MLVIRAYIAAIADIPAVTTPIHLRTVSGSVSLREDLVLSVVDGDLLSAFVLAVVCSAWAVSVKGVVCAEVTGVATRPPRATAVARPAEAILVRVIISLMIQGEECIPQVKTLYHAG